MKINSWTTVFFQAEAKNDCRRNLTELLSQMLELSSERRPSVLICRVEAEKRTLFADTTITRQCIGAALGARRTI